MKRRDQIEKILNENGVVYLQDIEKELTEVSSMTLRRDLEYLIKLGKAVKIKGGAKSISQANGDSEPVYSNRETKNQFLKEAIARAALDYIKPGKSVYLDSGTTNMELAKTLPDINLSILTSGPNIAVEILKRVTPVVNLVGGAINRNNLSVSGLYALSIVKNINIDTAFISPSGCSLSSGFSCGNYQEHELKRAVIKKSDKVIILMDSSKFDNTMPFTFATLKDIDVFITDKKPNPEFLEALKKANVELILT